MISPEQLPTTWTDSQRAKVLGGTAAKLYGITAAKPASV
jgi:hypothetical protein